MNDAVLTVLREFEVDVYAPQVELPLGKCLSPGDILAENTAAIERCNYVLSVLDKPGLGVAYELGLAMGLKRPILALRSSTGERLGMILEGLWNSLRPEARATNLNELRAMLGHHFKRHGEAAGTPLR